MNLGWRKFLEAWILDTKLSRDATRSILSSVPSFARKMFLLLSVSFWILLIIGSEAGWTQDRIIKVLLLIVIFHLLAFAKAAQLCVMRLRHEIEGIRASI